MANDEIFYAAGRQMGIYNINTGKRTAVIEDDNTGIRGGSFEELYYVGGHYYCIVDRSMSSNEISRSYGIAIYRLSFEESGNLLRLRGVRINHENA